MATKKKTTKKAVTKKATPVRKAKANSIVTGKPKPMTLHRDSATWLTLLVIIFMEDKGYDYSLF